MSGERFTSWLSTDERAALRELAHELHTSENFVVRMAVRATLFNKPVPEYVRSAAAKLCGNRSSTSNEHRHTTGART